MQPSHTPSDKPLLAVLAAILLIYGIALWQGWPQAATAMIAAEQAETAASAAPAQGAGEKTPAAARPPYGTVLPFVLLLGAIAVLPLVPRVAHWWDSNLHRFYVAAGLGLVTWLYYLFWHEFPMAGHFPVRHVVEPSVGWLNLATARAVLENALLNEYLPFIVLLFTLFTISGGIRIQGDLPAHPVTNSVFLGIGALLASLIGTTGAAMLLIRPLLETNRERKYVAHTVVVFIFVVCNCGGCLLPLGDPPLFLGYLLGVDFLWTLQLWREWLFVNGLLILVYLAWDSVWYYPHEKRSDIVRDETRVHRLQFAGLWPNGVLLLGVILSVALLDPSKPFPGTDWRPWMYLREIAQLALVAASLVLGEPAVRRLNQFSFQPIIEVAVLFLGIFLCMQPPLEVLHVEGPRLGLAGPVSFFWSSGSLSSVLDNAPTYVVFFETAKSLPSAGVATMAGVRVDLLAAVSLGAVMMGSMTYIGNGPNFMVKAIAEKSGVPMPSFFGYLLYSVCILLPILFLMTWIFL
ncbi:MAG: sodium:proton antiporter [Pirellulales bacterium]